MIAHGRHVSRGDARPQGFRNRTLRIASETNHVRIHFLDQCVRWQLGDGNELGPFGSSRGTGRRRRREALPARQDHELAERHRQQHRDDDSQGGPRSHGRRFHRPRWNRCRPRCRHHQGQGGATLTIDGTFTNAATGQITERGANAIVDLVGGSIDGGTVGIATGATLEATGGPSGPSTIRDGTVMTDHGIILATNDTTLTLANITVNAAISKTSGVITGGIIEADDGTAATASAIVLAAGTTINGAALATLDGGQILVAAPEGTICTSVGVTIMPATTVDVVDGGNLLLSGKIADNGTIAIHGANAPFTVLEIAGDGATLVGSGNLTLSDCVANDILPTVTGGSTLTNAVTISGAGQIDGFRGASGLTLINKGTIEATFADTPLVISGVDLTNTGTLAAANGAGLDIDAGTIVQGNGVFRTDATSVIMLTGGEIAGGQLHGNIDIEQVSGSGGPGFGEGNYGIGAMRPRSGRRPLPDQTPVV
jgi:hypothetical protein